MYIMYETSNIILNYKNRNIYFSKIFFLIHATFHIYLKQEKKL